ncbi:helix-turn-helix transcriptional regulator (plasmid) [Brevundimonas olei]|uniref:Helix-turn-helix transcriptional regulator n=1 Tax=Brevundimonas olei TaxID=657642 RepID=A0ABZ2IJT6_9CAUL
MEKPKAPASRKDPRGGQPFDPKAWPEMETFRLNLIKARTAKDLSQRELCTLTGLSQSFYSGLETGRRNPTIQLVAELARHLGIPMTQLLHDKTESPIGREVSWASRIVSAARDAEPPKRGD